MEEAQKPENALGNVSHIYYAHKIIDCGSLDRPSTAKLALYIYIYALFTHTFFA